ncbi:MAG: hypothetical protein ABIV43_02320 [Candidatus Saccharimonadales bacterium]
MKLPRLHATRRGYLLTLALLLTATNGGVLAYSILRPGAGDGKAVVVTKRGQVTSAKQRSTSAGTEGTLSQTGNYQLTTLRKSRIDPTSLGRLILATNTSLGSSFVLATDQSFSLDSSNLDSGWTAQNLSDDPLWAPGACASKPTLLLQGKYIFIDDGKTKPTDNYNSYLVYSLQDGSYKYFGGDNYSDEQAKHERILLAVNENDKLVFYIDHTDTSGPLTSSTAFKHARGSATSYLTRRVIDPATMKFTDYRISYEAPDTTPYYFVSLLPASGEQPITLDVSDDTGNHSYRGTVADNRVSLAAFDQSELSVQQTVATGPYDSAIEKQLDGPLTKLLPAFNTERLYDPVHSYATYFSINQIGSHGSLEYLVAYARAGQGATPVIYDNAKSKAYPMTTKTFLSYDNFVALGAL